MYEFDIHTLLSSFVPIALDEMDSVRLMNRVEIKYVFSAKKLPELLKHLSSGYKVLEINTIREFPYHTTYLDTPDLMFYTQQVRGKLNRHKIRYRRYESTGVSFLEIKKKTNKDRTIKWRIENYLNMHSPDNNASAFMKKYLPYNSLDLSPVLINKFTRITLVEKEFKERITLDYNIAFSSTEGRDIKIPFLAIAEIKRDGYLSQTPFAVIMKMHGIRPNNFSKYCTGSALVRNIPRINTLKPKLLLINKIQNEYNGTFRP
jgi:hypothetical protein